MSEHRSSSPWRWLIALLAVVALVAAACGDSDEDSESGDTETESGEESSDDEAEGDDTGDDAGSEDTGDDDTGEDTGDDGASGELTASAVGVTADTITVGISMLNFPEMVETNLSAAGWGDQEGVWQALIDDLNDRGGINGRMIEPVYDFYHPVFAEDAARSCTKLTEDQPVFAVLGGFVGPFAGTEDKCIVGQNATMLVGGELSPEELAEAQAPWYDVGTSTARATEVLLDLLIDSGDADGASVFVVTHQASQGGLEGVEAALDERDIERVESAVLDANDSDQAAQDGVMAVISERIRSSGANTVLIHGNPAGTIRGLINSGLMGEIAVWADDVDGLNNLGESIDRNQVVGVQTVLGQTDQEMYDDELMQSECIDVVQAALPDAEIVAPDDIGVDEENWFNSIRRYCRLLSMFEQIATAAGPELTYEAVAGVVDAGEFSDFAVPGTPKLSLAEDKPDGQALFRLGEYSVDESDGAATPSGELVDVFP
jgi:hypothetical protein